jgi:Na+-translocating ferredoxin:NAD+ oxidoreductase subunit C
MIQKTRNIPDGKTKLKQLPVYPYLDAPYLYYPITSQRCKEGETCVIGGEFVKVGDVIGTRKGTFFEQPMHATVSGEVVGTEKHLDQTGKMVDCLIIKNDFKYEVSDKVNMRSDEEISKMTREEIIKIIQDKGLVGLGGGAFPSYIKLETNDPIKVVLANGVECEPKLISDYAVMMEHPSRVIQGLIYAMQGAGALSGVIAIKKKYKEIKERLCFELKNYTMHDIKIVEVGNYYPQGWEVEVIKKALKINVLHGEMLSKHGIVNFNVSTLESIYQAVKNDLPVLERFISLSGEGIENMNFKARIGTMLSDLIELAGGVKSPEIPKVLILGGPMMGMNVMKEDIVMTHTTTSLIIENDAPQTESACVRCASCVYSCPVDLKPVQIMHAVLAKDKELLKALKVNHCIECGLCSYVCPSKIALTDYMKTGKRLSQ